MVCDGSVEDACELVEIFATANGICRLSRSTISTSLPRLLLDLVHIGFEPIEAGLPNRALLDQPTFGVVMAAGFNRQVRTRPLFWDSTRPPASSTRMCFIRLGSAMANGRASSPTDASPSPSRARIALLVGSARAPNTWSRCDDKLSIRLTIGAHRGVVNNSYPYGLLKT